MPYQSSSSSRELNLPHSSKGCNPHCSHREAEGQADGCLCSAQFLLCRYSRPQYYSMWWVYPSRSSLPTFQPLPANPQVILRSTTINCPESLMLLGSMHFRCPLCPACGCTNHWHYCNYHPCWAFICPQSCTQRFWPLFLFPCCRNLVQNCSDR